MPLDPKGNSGLGPLLEDFNPAAAFLKKAAERTAAAMPNGPDELMGRILELELAVRKLRSLGGGTAGGTGSADALQHPFQLQRMSDTQINVRFGTLNDYVPTDVATNISLSGSTTYTFYLDVEVDIDGEVVDVTLSHGTSGQPADDDYHGYITLGTVVISGSVIATINQAATHSLRMSMCGREVDPVGPTLDVRGSYEFWGF